MLTASMKKADRSSTRAPRRVAAVAGVLLALLPAIATAVVVVNLPWARPVAKGRPAEIFAQLGSTEGGALVGARSEFAPDVVIASPGAAGKPVARLPLPAGTPVILAPNAYRLRLSRVDRALNLGDWVPFVLIIESADGTRQEIPARAEVRRRSALEDHRAGHLH
jgi:copper(I)-binding protein